MRIAIHTHQKQRNYFKVGTNHIFIDFKSVNMVYLAELLEKDFDTTHTIHVFIPSIKSAETKALDFLIYGYTLFLNSNPDMRYHRLIIHIPKTVRDIYHVITHRFFINGNDGSFKFDKHGVARVKSPYRIICEKQGPSFRIPGSEYFFDVNYDDEGISAAIEIHRKKYEGYFPPKFSDPHVSAMITSRLRMKYPQLFKDELCRDWLESLSKLDFARIFGDLATSRDKETTRNDAWDIIRSRYPYALDVNHVNKILEDKGDECIIDE